MSEETGEIKIVGGQNTTDGKMVRITLDMSRVNWLILKSEIQSKSFHNIVEVAEKETKILEEH